MQAIIETGGKQYRVVSGDVIRIGKLTGEVGAEVEFPVKALFNDGALVDGAPTIKGTIVSNGKSPKVLVFKFKHKKQYKKTIGHRQDFTDVKVSEFAV